jgi:hypothetical protein
MQISEEGIYRIDFSEFFGAIYTNITGREASGISEGLGSLWGTAFAFYLFFVFVFSTILILGIIIVYRKNARINQEFKVKIEYLSGENYPPVEDGNPRWNKVLELLDSSNPSDWRMAILEADVILDELVSRMGYKGETLGDKMKSIERSDFRPIDDAWEAHKIRNILAHRGSDYILTKREARRAIDLYARVFEEFHFI